MEQCERHYILAKSTDNYLKSVAPATVLMRSIFEAEPAYSRIRCEKCKCLC